MFSTILPSRGANWTGLPVAREQKVQKCSVSACHVPFTQPCPSFPWFYSRTRNCRARFAPRGRKEGGCRGWNDRANIYPPRNLIPRARGPRLKILFPVGPTFQQEELQDGNGWRSLRNGEAARLASRRCERDVRRNGEERDRENRATPRSRRDIWCIWVVGPSQSPFNWVIRRPLNRTRVWQRTSASKHLDRRQLSRRKGNGNRGPIHRIWVVNNCSMLVNDERSFRIIGKITRIKVFFFFGIETLMRSPLKSGRY